MECYLKTMSHQNKYTYISWSDTKFWNQIDGDRLKYEIISPE